MRAAFRQFALIALLVLLATGVPGAANAATAIKGDPRGDAPRYIDISRVKYGNTEHRISARIRIPALERRGVARLLITKAGLDTGYWAKVKIASDGSLSERFTHSAGKRRCDFHARWDARDNVVVIAVPQRCVKSFGSGTVYVRAVTGHYRDWAPGVRRLGRG